MIETVPGRYGKISFISSDLTIGRSLRIYGEWAESEVRFLLTFVHSGDTVVDVGANIGTHTLAFARAVGAGGKVWAFEPRPEIFSVLDANIRENKLGNVVLRQAAVGSKSGSISLPAINLDAAGNFGSLSIVDEMSHVGDPATASAVACFAIGMTTIDALGLEACSLIKIDVEGAEVAVLQGARSTIEKTTPILYCECNSLKDGIELKKFYDFIGYLTYIHLTDAFNAENFNGVVDNFFGPAREAALIGVHRLALPGMVARSDGVPGHLLPVDDADATLSVCCRSLSSRLRR